jgi:EamA domain-containing membrane protein RarD
MYIERATIRRIEQVLLVGSLATLLAGLGLLFFPRTILALLRMEPQPAAFVQLSGLLLFVLGSAYALTLLEREKSKALLLLGFFQKLGAAVLILTGALLGHLPFQMSAVAVFDALLAALFLLHVRGARSDGWL